MYTLVMITRRMAPVLLLPLVWISCVTPGRSTTIVVPEAAIPQISVMDLKTLIDAGEEPFILDVRTPEEYDGPLGHIDGAVLIPVQELPDRLDELQPVHDRDIYAMCRSGVRSAGATRLLREAGFKAINVTGGMIAWDEMMQRDLETLEEVTQ